MKAKPREREVARRLRQEDGMPMKRIAAKLGVSLSSVSLWTRDNELEPAHRERNRRQEYAARATTWSDLNRAKRLSDQEEGRRVARLGNPVHFAGCMLYWAEGAKDRNNALIANSDVHMLRFFMRFLLSCFDLGPSDFSVRLNVYTGNGRSVAEIERHWLDALGLPRSCLRKHVFNHFPTSSGQRTNKLPFGVCTLRVRRSTRIVQHIYGAIQEYAGFEEPRWLD